jgi:hypothetical protein
MKSEPACHSMKKPRPGSAGFHHQPLSGWFASGVAFCPPGTAMSKRSIATVPPGQIIVRGSRR